MCMYVWIFSCVSLIWSSDSDLNEWEWLRISVAGFICLSPPSHTHTHTDTDTDTDTDTETNTDTDTDTHRQVCLNLTLWWFAGQWSHQGPLYLRQDSAGIVYQMTVSRELSPGCSTCEAFGGFLLLLCMQHQQQVGAESLQTWGTGLAMQWCILIMKKVLIVPLPLTSTEPRASRTACQMFKRITEK